MEKIKKALSKKNTRILVAVGAVLNVAVIVILIVALVFSNSRIERLQSQMNYTSDNTDILLNEINDLKTSMEKMVEEESSLIESWNLEVVDTDFAKGVYKVKVAVIPKEYSEETEAILYFGVNELPLTLENYRYTGQVFLSLNETFANNLTLLLVDGNKRRTEIIKGYNGLGTDFEGVLKASMQELPDYSEGLFKLKSAVLYELKGDDKFTFNALDLIVTADGQEISTINMLDPAIATNTGDTEASDEDEGAGKDKDEEATEQELATESLSNRSGNYISNEGIEVSEGAVIRVYLRAVTVDGFRFEYDLFNGITNQRAEDASEDEKAEGFVENTVSVESNAAVYDTKGGRLKLNSN